MMMMVVVIVSGAAGVRLGIDIGRVALEAVLLARFRRRWSLSAIYNKCYLV